MRLIDVLFRRIEGMVDPFAAFEATIPDKRALHYGADHLRPFRRVMVEAGVIIAIAHRLATFARMDRIVVMEAGRIVEAGPHDVLLAQDGIYARFWNRQSGGFIGTEAGTDAGTEAAQ